MKTLKQILELDLLSAHDDFELMLMPSSNDYYTDECEFYHIPCSYSISEAITKSYPVSVVCKQLKDKQLGLVSVVSDYKIMLLTVGFDIDRFNRLKHILEAYGWYVATVKTGNITSKDYDYDKSIGSIFYIEAKFQDETSVSKTLYHVTPTKNVKKIMSIGLSARSQCVTMFNYPERVYLIDVPEDKVTDASISYAKQSQKRYDDWTILKIDTTKTNNVFYRDINVPNDTAVWTGEPIRPSAISIERNFKI